MTTTTSTPTTDRPDLGELATIHHDLDDSTGFAEVYRADSDTYAGRLYRVVFYPVARAWTCNCPGFTAHHHCKHCERADRKRRVRFFSALFAGQPPRVLRAELARREERIASGTADADDFACADFCTLRLGNMEAAASTTPG